MIRTSSMALTALLCMVSLSAAGQGVRPFQFSISLVGGADYSYIEAKDEMAVYFEPLPGTSIHLKSPGFGVQADFMFGRVFGAMLGMSYDRRGQYSEPTTVEFKDDPFEHDFETRTVASYTSITLAGKAGYRFERQWIQVILGIEPAFVLSDSLDWIIDDQVAATPSVVADNDFRLVMGIEYGFRYKWFGVFGTASYHHGTTDIAWGLDGTSRARALSGRIGVRYFFMAREERTADAQQ